MTLEETYEAASPSIVALGSKLVKSDKPIFPEIIGTGFVVDSRGIIATNRHVALPLQQLRVHPKTGMPVTFAMFIGPLMQVEGKRTRASFSET